MLCIIANILFYQSEENMNRQDIYITRHGQVASKSDAEFLGSADFPANDPPLSALGREQARLTGVYLKNNDFHGIIYSSPFRRTLETASIIAKETGSILYPLAAIHEIIRTEESAKRLGCMTMAQIREAFPNQISPEADLIDRWWSQTGETMDDVCKRVSDGLNEAAKVHDFHHCLFVGHGASCYAMVKHFKIHSQRGRHIFNCAICRCNPDDPTAPQDYASLLHIPYEKRSNNFKTNEMTDEEEFQIPNTYTPILPDITGRHLTMVIGHTRSWNYAYLRRIIEVIKPETILHTGEFVDEAPAGQNPENRFEYVSKVGRLCSVLNSSGADIIVSVGKGDLPDVLSEKLPNAAWLSADTFSYNTLHSVWLIDSATSDVFHLPYEA